MISVTKLSIIQSRSRLDLDSDVPFNIIDMSTTIKYKNELNSFVSIQQVQGL